MPLINPPVPSDGEDADAADIAIPINLIVALLNGNLDGDNISSTTALVITSLIASGNIEGATITANTKVTSKGDIEQYEVSLNTIRGDTMFDHVASGCVLTRTSGLGWSLSAGVVYIGGRRYTVAATTGNVTASKDTYFDVTSTGASGSAAVLVNTSGNIVNNNAASPALASNSIRIGIVVAGASIAADTDINQGQETRVKPIASSIPYTVTDSLGNLICPRDPQRKLLGYRQITASVQTTSGTAVQATGLTAPVIVPANRKVQVTAYVRSLTHSGGTSNAVVELWKGTVASGTQLNDAVNGTGGAVTPIGLDTPGAGSFTYNVGFKQLAAGTVTISAFAAVPAFIKVELV